MSLEEVGGLRDQPESEWFVDDQGKVLNLKFPIYQNNNTLKAQGVG